MPTVRIACAQVAPRIGDEPGNRQLAREAIREAAGAGAELVVLPELMSTGYVFASREEAAELAQPVGGPALAAWSEEAAATGTIVVGGFAEAGDDGLLYNSAALVDGSGVIAVYRKLHLWDAERDVFAPGGAPAPVVETRLGRIGLAVCYDLEFPELTRSLALGGADVLCVPTNWPREERAQDERAMLVTLVQATARLSKVFFALCDRTGTERGAAFEGGSVIADEQGRLLAGPERDRGRAILVADCDLGRARDKSWNGRNDAVADRRPALYAMDNASGQSQLDSVAGGS